MSPRTRRLRLLLIYAAVAFPAIVVGAIGALSNNSNSPLDWVAPSFPARRAYDDFCRVFGPGDAIIAGWPGATIHNPCLDELRRRLIESPEFYAADGVWLLDEVVTGREVWQRLLDRPIRVTPAEARRRLQGTLLGSDGETTGAVIVLSPAGLAARRQLVPRVQATICEVCSVTPEELRLAGPAIDGHSVDVASQRAMNRLAGPSLLISVLVCYACLRSWRAAAIVCGIAVYCQGATLALLYYSGETMSALHIVLPPLVQVLAVASGIHLMNYYFNAAQTYDPLEAPRRAFQLGWLPCTLSLGTTAIGTGSLVASQLSPIRSFGAFASGGILLTLGLLLSLIPAALHFWPPALRPLQGEQARRVRAGWDWLARCVARRHAAITAITLLAMLFCGAGLLRLQTSVRIETLFDRNSQLLRDYAWLEQQLGPLVPVEVVFTCSDDCTLSLRQRVERVAAIERAMREIPEIAASRSAVTFLPSMPRRGVMLQSVYDGLVTRTLDGALPKWRDARVVAETESGQRWRITGLTSALAPVDYGQLLDVVRKQVQPQLLDAAGKPLPGVELEFTGVMPLVHAIQRRLMDDLFYSYLGTLVVITLVMTIVQAGILAGLVAMLSNVFPLTMVLGTLGWLGWQLDIGTVMTASIALGIAVDDTLHFLTFYRREIDSGRARIVAVRQAYRHCGSAMLQSSLICVLGMLAFAASDFLPIARFTWVLVAMVTTALVGDLVLLPSLLLGIAGRAFVERARGANVE